MLDNGYLLETDLVVLTAGGRPSTALARAAGLEVRRGIVVDDQLRTSDDRIHAIGDCAQHAGRVTGFVPPAWEQASLLARHLTGEDVAYAGSRSVARLRATDLDVAVLGDPERRRRRGRPGLQPDHPLAPQARRPRRGDRRRHPGRRPVPDRPDHPALRPRHRPRRCRARRPADGDLRRRRQPAGGPPRRRRGLRLRRRQRRPDPRLRLPRRGPRVHACHHRLRRLRSRRTQSPRHARPTLEGTRS